jgi:hypothetical protein
MNSFRHTAYWCKSCSSRHVLIIDLSNYLSIIKLQQQQQQQQQDVRLSKFEMNTL